MRFFVHGNRLYGILLPENPEYGIFVHKNRKHEVLVRKIGSMECLCTIEPSV